MSRLSWYIWIRGQRWWFSLTQPHHLEEGEPEYDTEGDCDFDRRRIRVSLDLPPKRLIYVVVHEVLHGCQPDLDEQAVIETANAIANGLWKLTWVWNPAWRRDARKEKRSRN